MKFKNDVICGKLATLLMLCGMPGILSSCSSVEDNSGDYSPQYTGVPLVIYDTDIGSSTDNLSPLTGIELVRQKVKCLYLMAGVFTNSEEPDYNFLQGPEFAVEFFELWPDDVDIVFSPMEVGNDIEYTPETVIQAVEGDALFSLSERCTVSLNGRGGTVFTPSATGNCRYQKPSSKAWAT